MQVIYRVILTTRTCPELWVEFNNPEQATRFADSAAVSNVESTEGNINVRIELLQVRREDG